MCAYRFLPTSPVSFSLSLSLSPFFFLFFFFFLVFFSSRCDDGDHDGDAPSYQALVSLARPRHDVFEGLSLSFGVFSYSLALLAPFSLPLLRSSRSLFRVSWGEGGRREGAMRCKLVTLLFFFFFPFLSFPLLRLLLFLTPFHPAVYNPLASSRSRSCTFFFFFLFFFSLLPCNLSCSNDQEARGRQAGNRLEIRERVAAHWLRRNHVAAPPTPASAPDWSVFARRFSQPAFACMRARSLARSLVQVACARTHDRACTRVGKRTYALAVVRAYARVSDDVHTRERSHVSFSPAFSSSRFLTLSRCSTCSVPAGIYRVFSANGSVVNKFLAPAVRSIVLWHSY